MTQFSETRESLIIQVKDPSNRDAWGKFVDLYRPVIHRIAIARGMQDADALEGISLGSTSDEIIAVYGEPNGIRHPDGSTKPPRKENTTWQYEKLGYVFSLDADGKVASIGIGDGKPNRLRFEWRVPVRK